MKKRQAKTGDKVQNMDGSDSDIPVTPSTNNISSTPSNRSGSPQKKPLPVEETFPSEDTSITDQEQYATSKMIKYYVDNPVVVIPNNPVEIKVALDDALKKIMSDDRGFTEDFRHVDIKLLLGYGACAFAAFASIYSYLVPFPECKPILLMSVAGYFILNALLILYTGAIEQNIVYIGYQKDALGIDPTKSLVISSRFSRDTASYCLEGEMKLTAVGSAKAFKGSKAELTIYIGDVLDEEGHLFADIFYSKFMMMINNLNTKLD